MLPSTAAAAREALGRISLPSCRHCVVGRCLATAEMAGEGRSKKVQLSVLSVRDSAASGGVPCRYSKMKLGETMQSLWPAMHESTV